MSRRFVAALVLASLIWLAGATHAATPTAVLIVESVLSPAWVERANGRREPLAAGAALGPGDKLHTGDGGRAMLRLAEGSAVRLGESALLAVDDLARQPGQGGGGLVRAALDVARGAFRFTTAVLAKPEAERDVRIRVNAVTAGIRGTDVWGKADVDRDIVCLLEGRVHVTHGAAQFTMSEPLSFYIAPRAGAAAPPSRVTPEQVKAWAAETDIDAGAGALTRGGAAAVIVAAASDARSAAALRDKLRESGFPATLVRAADRHAVRIGSIADAASAAVLAKRLQALGFGEARAAQ